MRPQGDGENYLNWDDGHIPYNPLSSDLNVAVAGFAYLYACGDSGCTLPRYFRPNSVVPNPVTEIPRSIAQLDTRITFLSG